MRVLIGRQLAGGMRRLWEKKGGVTLAAAVVAVAVSGLAALAPAAGLVPAAHAEQGMIVVADRGNDRLQAFYPDGTFAFKFGEGFGRALSIDVGPDGRIVVAGGNRDFAPINVFHPNGSWAFGVASIGSSIGQIEGGYLWWTGEDRVRFRAFVAPDGRIVAVETGRVQVFGPDGMFESVVEHGSEFAALAADVAPDGMLVTASPSYWHDYHDYSYGPTRDENGTFRWAAPNQIRAYHPNGTEAFSFEVFGSNSSRR